MYLNKALIIGNLTRDPELKSLPNGSKVVSLSLATNRYWKDQSGARQEAVEYHNVVAFGRTAETVAQYVHKGDQLSVEGRLQTRSWDDQGSGKKMYRTEIVADNIQFGTKRGAGGETPAAPKETTEQASFDNNLGSIDYGESINPEDIPF